MTVSPVMPKAISLVEPDWAHKEIPPEVWKKILEGVSRHDLLILGGVDRHLRMICRTFYVWKDWLFEDFAFYESENPKPRLDRNRIDCIVVNLLAGYQKTANELRIANSSQNQTERKRLSKEMIGSESVRPELKHTLDQQLYEQVPAGQEPDKYFNVYAETAKDLLALAESKEMEKLPTPFSLTTSNEGTFPYVSWIRKFPLNDVRTYRHYYRLLRVWKHKLAHVGTEGTPRPEMPTLHHFPPRHRLSNWVCLARFAGLMVMVGCVVFVAHKVLK